MQVVSYKKWTWLQQWQAIPLNFCPNCWIVSADTLVHLILAYLVFVQSMKMVRGGGGDGGG